MRKRIPREVTDSSLSIPRFNPWKVKAESESSGIKVPLMFGMEFTE